MKKKVAIITTHPIQYNAPLFQLLTSRGNIEIMVFYTWGESVLENKFDPGFKKKIEWDIPLLQNYPYKFLINSAEDKGSHHYKGIINPDITDEIDRFDPDALLVYGWSFKSHLKVLKHYKNKIPVVFRGDSTLLDQSGFFSRILRNIFLRYIYHYVDYALYVGKNNYQYFKKAGLKEKQLVLGPHVIDNERFACSTDTCRNAANELRSKMNIGHDDLVFLFAGKIEPKKDPELLLKAFTKNHFTTITHLVIVGNGILENELKQQYAKFDNIHFLDFQNQTQMPSVYQMADVFVLPSRGPGETWGLAINEAMANGKAIIVSDKCGCAPDLVKNGENGYVFSAGSETELIDKMVLLQDEERRKNMKQASKKIIEQYSLQNLAIAIENLIINISNK